MKFFRINEELNFDLKFWSVILSKAFKNLAAKLLKFAGHFLFVCGIRISSNKSRYFRKSYSSINVFQRLKRGNLKNVFNDVLKERF